MNPAFTYRFPFAKYPAIRLALLFGLGIVLSKIFALPTVYLAGFFGVMIICRLTFEYLSQKTLQPRFTYFAIGFYLSGIVVFGAFWQTIFDKRTVPASAKLLAAYTWQPVDFTGKIENINQTSTGKYQLDVAINRTVLGDSLTWNEPYKMRAIYNPDDKPRPKSLKLGAKINFNATIYPLEGKRNPYAFDYKKYLASQHIYVQVGIEHISDLQPNTHWLSWTWLRQRTLELVDANFAGQTAPLAKALLIGYKNELERGEKIAFSRAGLSHIMAVSGLHVGFIIAPFWFVIPLFWTFRRGKQIGLFLFCVLLFTYTGLTGFSASVTRAAITGGLLTYGRLFYKSRDSKNLTAVAAIIILLCDPNQIFEIGFQLSFAAVYIILLILPVFQRLIPQKIQHRWYGIPIMAMLVSFVVQFGLYPILSYYFGEFSLVGPLANALIVPWLSVMIPYALFLLLLSAVAPSAGFMMNAPCRWFLHLLHWLVNVMVQWNWSWIQTPTISAFVFYLWLAAVLLIAALPFAKIRWKTLIIFLALLCFWQVKNIIQKLRPPKLKITMLDVGQGDAAFITTPTGKHFLIDTGRWTPTYNSARYVIIPHLKALDVQKLDAVFLSHPHADHIGGLPELIKQVKIDTIYNSGQPYDSKLFQRYHTLARQHHIPVKPLHAGMQIPLDSDMRIYIYGPNAENHSADVNEHSLVMELVYGKTQFLFMGDAGASEEHLLVNQYPKLLRTDFLKVGHHGSRTSSSAEFLQDITPNFAGISLGLNNHFRHPNAEAIHRINETHPKLFFTSLNGALQFQSDGSIIKFVPWR